MALEVAPSDLVSSLDLAPRELVSIVGGGGKTTTLFLLGRDRPGRTVMTTTTKMGRERTGGYPVLLDPTEDDLIEALDRDGSVLAWQEATRHKAVGVTPERCDSWFEFADTVAVEADGSRQRPFKAPRPFEPVIPSRTTTVLACIGADALGRVIGDQCQRPLRVAAAAGCQPYERLTPARAAAVLTSDRGSQKGRPPGARFVVVVTRVDESSRQMVIELAGRLEGRAEIVAVTHSDLTGL
ncbi:MAG: selenium cofactor biosynthesis protein YqeC [Acidimicrobiales bacterium]